MRLHAPDFVTLTYETTTRAMRRDIARALDAPLFQLYGATEAGVLFMECEHGRLHHNARHSHIELVPMPGTARLARVVVTTLGPHLDAAAALRHRRRGARGRARDCACGLRSDGSLLERIEGRLSDCTEVDGETITPPMLDDAIDAARATRRSSNGSSNGDSLQVVDPGSRDSAERAARAVGALLAPAAARRARARSCRKRRASIGW